MSEERGFIARQLVTGITAASEGLFPPNDFGAPDYRDAQMVQRTLAYLQELPPPQRRMLTVLYIAVEWLAPLLLLFPRRFSRMPPAHRAHAVRTWRRSRFLLLRALGDALKAATTMMYMSHPRVVAYIGEHRACAHPTDALGYEVRRNALPRGVEP